MIQAYGLPALKSLVRAHLARIGLPAETRIERIGAEVMVTHLHARTAALERARAWSSPIFVDHG